MPLSLARRLGRHAASLPAVAAQCLMNIDAIEARLSSSRRDAQSAFREDSLPRYLKAVPRSLV